MVRITNPNISLAYNLNHYQPSLPGDGDDDLYHVVVQKGNVGESYVYALQLLHNGHNIYVFRGRRQTDVAFAKNDPVLRLIGQGDYTAGGHTQTWEYAGRSGDWLVGTKPSKDDWTIQITRVHIPDGTKIYENTKLPRLSHLNYAGGFHIDMKRVEAAVSPDYQSLLVASVDQTGNGYFSVYSMKQANDKLTDSQYHVSNGIIPDVDIRSLDLQKSFRIPNITDSSKIGSLQGYDIDNGANNIYVSSGFGPGTDGYKTDKSRKIIKIPWNTTEKYQWSEIPLDETNENGYIIEPEGLQLISDNDVYVTIAYHEVGDNLTVMNRIYRVTW